jgi:hypothetical protein
MREDLKKRPQAWPFNMTRIVSLAAGQRRTVGNMRELLVSTAYEEVFIK